MSEMSERVAKAIIAGSARAAIEAMSQPTPEMIAAMVRMHRTLRSGEPETLVHDIWQSGCDAALADEMETA